MAMPKRADKSLNPDFQSEELLAFRRQIDTMDEQIIQLLKERAQVVQQVGAYKTSQGQQHCFIRPGREADMLRHIWQQFDGEAFSQVAAAAMWRLIIGASTNIEHTLNISVYAPEGDPTLSWLAREYFGPFCPVTRHPNARRVLGDVIDGKAGVGILPPVQDETQGDWWLVLAEQGDAAPKLFAHVPFVTHSNEARRHSSYAIAHVQPEPTEDDITLIAVQTTDVSLNRLITAFSTARFKAARLQYSEPDAQNHTWHLLRVEGFIDGADERLANLFAPMKEGVANWHVLGSYASPILTKDVS